MTDERGSHYGLVGSYCWGDICVDKVAPYMRGDLKQKLKLQEDSKIRFNVKNYYNPKKFHVTLFSERDIILNKTCKEEMKLEVPEGTYFLNVMASWEGKGDVSYVFLIQVMKHTE